MIPDSHCSCEDCGPNKRQLSSALEDNGRLQRQLFTAKERVVELDRKLAIAINLLDRAYRRSNERDVEIIAFLKDQ